MSAVATALLGTPLTLADTRSVMPYDIARSALFSSLPGNAKRTVYTAPKRIVFWRDSKKKFALYQRTGAKLTQTEASFWLELLRLAVQADDIIPESATPGMTTKESSARVCFSANGMLRKIGRKKPDSKARADLRDAIARLGDTRIELVATTGTKTIRYSGNLLDIASVEGPHDARIVCYINLHLAQLFNGNDWTFIDLDQRHALKPFPLAQWLHAYYSTHAYPLELCPKTLKVLCGRERSREKEWLSKLEESLRELARVTGWSCTLNSKGRVEVTKKPIAKVPAAPAAAGKSTTPTTTVPAYVSQARFDEVHTAFAHLSAPDRRRLERYIEQSNLRYIRRQLEDWPVEIFAPYDGEADIRWKMREMLALNPELLAHRIALAKRSAEAWKQEQLRAKAAECATPAAALPVLAAEEEDI